MKRPIYIIAGLTLIILVGGVVAASFRTHQDQIQETAGKPTPGRIMAIEDYIKLNISQLSPEKEVLGGKFYVTSIHAQDGKGTVSYEDGHNAFTADFTYTTDIERGHTITSFIIKK
jgi:hypothetical protein